MEIKLTSSWVTDDHLVGRLKASCCELVHAVRLVTRLTIKKSMSMLMRTMKIIMK